MRPPCDSPFRCARGRANRGSHREFWQTRLARAIPCPVRQEAGYLLVGNEHDAETNPLEAGIGRVVRFDKPDFVGREALAAVRRNGVTRSLVWFRLDDENVAETGDDVAVDGVPIGRVTSGSFSPTFGRGVGMAYVDPNHAIPGLAVTVRTTHGERSGTVSTMPLYDPGDVRTRTPKPSR